MALRLTAARALLVAYVGCQCIGASDSNSCSAAAKRSGRCTQNRPRSLIQYSKQQLPPSDADLDFVYDDNNPLDAPEIAAMEERRRQSALQAGTTLLPNENLDTWEENFVEDADESSESDDKVKDDDEPSGAEEQQGQADGSSDKKNESSGGGADDEKKEENSDDGDDEGFDCTQGHENWKLGWSELKKEFCCKTAGTGCKAEKATPTSAPKSKPSQTKATAPNTTAEAAANATAEAAANATSEAAANATSEASANATTEAAANATSEAAANATAAANSTAEAAPASEVNATTDAPEAAPEPEPNATATAAPAPAPEPEPDADASAADAGNASVSNSSGGADVPTCKTQETAGEREGSFFTRISPAGSTCVFGVDARDEGEHCIMEAPGSSYGAFGWCYTEKDASSWGSCDENCPLVGPAKVLGRKIDDLKNSIDGSPLSSAAPADETLSAALAKVSSASQEAAEQATTAADLAEAAVASAQAANASAAAAANASAAVTAVVAGAASPAEAALLEADAEDAKSFLGLLAKRGDILKDSLPERRATPRSWLSLLKDRGAWSTN